jgi:type II secretion system protein G
MKLRRSKKGFTLVEIMIVVAIIALIAAIAIPNLLRARHNANETAAIASLRTLSTAMESWRAVNGAYPTTAQGLAGLSGATPPYIDATLGTGTKQGYTFAYAQVSANQYTCTATPQVYQTTGTRSFAVQEDGVIRGADNNGAALARDGGTPI